GHDQPRFPLIHVDFEFDWRKDRIVKLLDCSGKHLKYRGAWLGVLAADDAQQHFALFRSRAGIDDDSGFTLALVNRSRPMKDPDESQSVQPSVAVKTGINLETADRFTESMCRKRVELARATICAIAVNEFLTLDRPLHIHQS